MQMVNFPPHRTDLPVINWIFISFEACIEIDESLKFSPIQFSLLYPRNVNYIWVLPHMVNQLSNVFSEQIRSGTVIVKGIYFEELISHLNIFIIIKNYYLNSKILLKDQKISSLLSEHSPEGFKDILRHIKDWIHEVSKKINAPNMVKEFYQPLILANQTVLGHKGYYFDLMTVLDRRSLPAELPTWDSFKLSFVKYLKVSKRVNVIDQNYDVFSMYSDGSQKSFVFFMITFCNYMVKFLSFFPYIPHLLSDNNLIINSLPHEDRASLSIYIRSLSNCIKFPEYNLNDLKFNNFIQDISTERITAKITDIRLRNIDKVAITEKIHQYQGNQRAEILGFIIITSYDDTLRNQFSINPSDYQLDWYALNDARIQYNGITIMSKADILHYLTSLQTVIDINNISPTASLITRFKEGYLFFNPILRCYKGSKGEWKSPSTKDTHLTKIEAILIEEEWFNLLNREMNRHRL